MRKVIQIGVKVFIAANGPFDMFGADTPGLHGTRSMVSSKTMIVVKKVYDNVECALWAGLLSFVLWFVTCVAPNLPETVRRAESLRALKVVEENSGYCERWGMKEGTREHALCTIDLRQLRQRIENEFAADGGIL
jgi:hypothetical protein